MRFLVVLLTLWALSEARIDFHAKDRRISIKIPGLGKWNPSVHRKIIGVKVVIPQLVPYQAAMIVTSNQDSWFCAGSLLSTTFVLTAAYCVDGATEAIVMLGPHTDIESEESQIHINAKKILPHPQYSATEEFVVNDIALIELNEAVTLNEYIQLVSLPTEFDVNNTFANQKATLSGWEMYADNATDTSFVSRSMNVNVMTNSECNVQWGGVVLDTQVCSSGGNNAGTCSGDSGDPLVIGNKQIGVASYANGKSCEFGWPVLYTRVTSYLDFINDALKK